MYFQIAYFIDDYKGWGRLALTAAMHESKTHPPALVLSTSPPLSVSWVGALAARRLGVPHLADLRDPWSDVVAHLYPHRRIELKLTRAVERWIMRRAGAITSTSATVASRLIHRQPELATKTFIIRNGYDSTVNLGTRDTNGRLAILFAGELYLNRDPFPFLQALERLLSRPEVRSEQVSVTFMGRRTEQFGSAIDRWLEGKRCAAAVKVLDTQPPNVVAEATRKATVLLNLAQAQSLSIPAKTFEHLASGKENLLLCEDDSESAQLVANIPGVIQVNPCDSDALDRALLDLYERHVHQGKLRAPTEQDVLAFSRATANERFWQTMIALAPDLQNS
jgi:glycosyltransferase involved in cell wall biosynthesis